MGVRIGSGLSTEADARFGAAEAAAAARDALGGRPCDLAVVFAFSGAHLAAPEATLEGVHEALAPAELVGCGAGGVIGEMREVEEGTAVSVWAAALDGGEATPFHAEVEAIGDGDGVLCRPARPDRRRGGAAALRPVHVPDRRGAARAVALRADAAAAGRPRLRAVARRGDAAPARRRGLDGGRGRRPLRRRRDPAVRLAGRGTGRARADDHRRRGTDHRRARGQAGAREAARDDRGARRRGPADGPGRAADGDRDRREQARLRAGRLPRPRARRRRPRHGPGGRRQRRAAGSGRPPARARRRQRRPRPARRARRADARARRAAAGRRAADLLQRPRRGDVRAQHHDASALDAALGGAPAAGFFAAGEIGPVGGEYFVHSFTATVALFA